MAADRDTRALILQSVPQQKPFRFIDEILELDKDRIKGAYRFRGDEFFYQGHFPGRPITPGVILVETMAQSGVVALAIYIAYMDGTVRLEDVGKYPIVFTYVESVEFTDMVLPGDRVIVEGEKIYYRRKSMKAKVRVKHEDGRPVCSGILAGMRLS